VRIAASPTGITASQIWKNQYKEPRPGVEDGRERFFASPALYEGLLIIQNMRGWLYAINPATGEVVKYFDLAAKPLAGVKSVPQQGGWGYFSPTVAGRYLFVGKGGGPVVVFHGKDLKEVARNYLHPAAASTMAFHGDRAYYRGKTHLYCIGASGAPTVGGK
jgi:outer membrane protein assembly factor BamB